MKRQIRQSKSEAAAAREAAEALAIQALTYIAADGDRLGHFLAESGAGPAEIRRAAADPGFLLGVLDYVAGDESLLVGLAEEIGFDPFDVAKARLALAGKRWDG